MCVYFFFFQAYQPFLEINAILAVLVRLPVYLAALKIEPRPGSRFRYDFKLHKWHFSGHILIPMADFHYRHLRLVRLSSRFTNSAQSIGIRNAAHIHTHRMVFVKDLLVLLRQQTRVGLYADNACINYLTLTQIENFWRFFSKSCRNFNSIYFIFQVIYSWSFFLALILSLIAR